MNTLSQALKSRPVTALSLALLAWGGVVWVMTMDGGLISWVMR